MKARLDGAEIEYRDEGRGPALLLLHAFPLGLFMWDEQAAALSGTHRVARFDARGFGASDGVDGALTMDRIADDGALLLDRLGIDRAVVGGCSMGGYAALAFARRHPQRLLGLYLQDTKAAPDTDEARANRATLAAKVLAEGAGAAVEAFLPKLLGETTRRENPALEERLRGRILATPPQGIANALHGLGARPDARPGLASIGVPTLVAVGEEDVLTPPAEAESLASAIRGARLVRLPGAGHLANLEQPEAVRRALAEFLAALPS